MIGVRLNVRRMGERIFLDYGDEHGEVPVAEILSPALVPRLHNLVAFTDLIDTSAMELLDVLLEGAGTFNDPIRLRDVNDPELVLGYAKALALAVKGEVPPLNNDKCTLCDRTEDVHVWENPDDEMAHDFRAPDKPKRSSDA